MGWGVKFPGHSLGEAKVRERESSKRLQRFGGFEEGIRGVKQSLATWQKGGKEDNE